MSNVNYREAGRTIIIKATEVTYTGFSFLASARLVQFVLTDIGRGDMGHAALEAVGTVIGIVAGVYGGHKLVERGTSKNPSQT